MITFILAICFFVAAFYYAFVVKKYKDQAENFSLSELKELLRLFEDTEYRIKTGLISDRNGLEIIISKALA